MQREHATTLDEIGLVQMQQLVGSFRCSSLRPHAALAVIRRATPGN
jgi:hypothetical protein